METTDKKRLKMLVVDDNEKMRRMIRNIVKDLAGEIFECGDGAEALAAYEQHQPDWTLMDVRMKGINGIEATRRIKARWPEARIVIVTNYDSPDLREEAAKAGAEGYILKENLFEVRRFLIPSP